MAVVVAICTLVGVIGYGLVQFEFASSAPPSSVSLIADDVERAETDHDSSPVAQKAFDAVALHRALPPRLRSTSLWRWTALSISLQAAWSRFGVTHPGAPPTFLAGQQLLTHFCIARR
ncbi:putative copper homeostasis (lipo)protein LpqS [Mycobacterium branderi]|uniref:Lipoprotein LpqS n=1 Tax=Mycobacterium branderi TaxID=43348 RepID=A0A7I7W0A1_9MYCO|nr:hypothetical protein [Mycobacterium branderi]MCV7233078.1 hypothetical protein [Mycobacterium branderi]ORA41175.1 hypothetical protein BST20_03350 [Mycobacterium branderi]BBZ10185.1 hypothetical protein MBRA_03800 [Mycobacterium branderi]